jgi:AsmA protein
MLKLFKTLLISLLALIALIAIAVTTAFMVIDPVRYRPALESAFASQTGLQLSMAGDISWTFRPVFGLAVSDLRLRNPGSPMELASLAQLNIKLEPRALLDGRLALQQLQMDGLHVNWLVDEGGRSIWQTEDSASAAATGTQPPATSQPDSAGSAVDTSTIAQISIRNASVAVQDRQRGLNSRFDNVTLSSSNSNLRGRPFPVELAFALTQEDGADQAVVSLSTLARVDLAAGKATLDDLVLKLNPLQLSGAISVENFRDALSLRGSLQSNTFPLSDFLDLYVRSTAEAAPGNALPEEFSTDTDQFSMSVDFAGNAQQMDITALRLSLDQMRVDATATWSAAQPGAPAALRYSLNGNALDLARYTQGAQASPTPGELQEATPADEPAAGAVAVARIKPRHRHGAANRRAAGHGHRGQPQTRIPGNRRPAAQQYQCAIVSAQRPAEPESAPRRFLRGTTHGSHELRHPTNAPPASPASSLCRTWTSRSSPGRCLRLHSRRAN